MSIYTKTFHTMENINELSKYSKNLFYLKKTIFYLLMSLKHQINKNNYIRTNKIVKASYNDSAYYNFINREPWEKTDNLMDFILTDIEIGKKDEYIKKECIIQNKLYKTSIRRARKYSTAEQILIFRKFISEKDEIVEIGCGLGHRLFSLAVNGFKNKLVGYDISENGILACRNINEHFKCDIKFDIFDLLSEESFINIEGRTVFSHHVLEQLKYDTEKILYKLLKGAPKQVIHFEPVVELNKWNLEGLASTLYAYARDYQNNLLKTLKRLERRHLLEITDVYTLGCSTNPLNKTSFIRWLPTND